MTYRSLLPLLPLALSGLFFACGTESITPGAPGGSSGGSPSDDAGPTTVCTSNEQCGDEGSCDVATGACAVNTTPPGSELGMGDGTAASVTFTEIYTTSTKGAKFTDLAFQAGDPTQLWIIGYGDDSVHVGSDVTGEANGTFKRYVDPAAGHFMHQPPAIAMGAEGLWGICGDNANAQNDPRGEPNDFMGPALFTSDLKIFATQNTKTKSRLGSHYDMLHNTSMCRGIAHMDANRFWTFNGQLGAIEKYDFAKPHEPGGEDHSDGEIYRYALGQVKGVDGVSSHMFYDASDKMLYIADTGNKRIGKLDTTTGTLGKALPRRNEVLAKNGMMDGTTVEDVVAAGTLTQPSGIEVKGELIYVTDAATGMFHVFDKTGKEVRKLETGLPAGALSGFTFGPDGKIWFVDQSRDKVLRIDPL